MILVLGAVKSLGEGSDRDIDGFFSLLYYRVLSLFTKPEALREQVTPLIHTITTSPDHTLVKYRILSNFFNTLPRPSPLRLEVYNALLTVASSQGDLDVLNVQQKEVEQWLEEWDVSPEEKSTVLKRLADTFAGNNQSVKSYEFLQMYTQSLPPTSLEAASAVLETVALGLRLPTVVDFDSLLRLDAIKSVKDYPILSLLRIFVGGTYSDFSAWLSSNEGVLSQFKLEKSALERKMRLLTLANLGAQNVGATVPYSTIASTLRIDTKEVEAWVIDGMRLNLIGGKLSQLSQTLHITRATYRVFKPTDWSHLQEKLTGWKTELLGVLDVIAGARQARGSTGHKIRAVTEAEQIPVTV